MCKVPTFCCLVLVVLVGLVKSQMPIQNIQLEENGEDNEMVRISEQSGIRLCF